ncbi:MULTISPECIES: alginate O-acetyltransferase [unclassified Pseudomonas]|uniref:alginate O-acetyltransferase n=1 Tax=unclassified Pseudomonas TaxID=196821 RepID=UPI002446D8B1|nr:MULTISPECIES: alginate O-acetyltransferase [unclassified Pseudomonas]MDG9924105.1 alginate O-acetyltransferase [Pseudomonas sp. GD04045]MDH0036535.1 alginate O-acetyltransferase [Pseudomonas sp. GD04019]
MTRYANVIYSLAFILVMLGLALSSLPAALSFSASSDTSIVDGKLTSTFEKHYDKGFVLKDFGTNAWAALEFGLFGEGRPGVVVGRDEWLYTAEEFNPPSNAQQLTDNWQLIQGVQGEFKRRGIELVVLLLPAKARLYPEYLAEQKPIKLQQELYQDAQQRMQRTGLQGPNLLAALEAGKRQGQVFLRTDTHWTPYGSAVVADAVADYLRERNWPAGDTRYSTRVTGSETHKGDLLTYLPLDPYFVSLQPAQEPLEKRVTEQGEEGGDLFGSNSPQMALVGTSYSANPKWNFLGALRQSLGSDLYNYAEDGHGPLVPMLRLLAKGEEETRGLKLVLWEVPERYLTMPSDLTEFDAQWLAQLRAGPDSAERLALKGSAKPLAAQ